ncbi:hypothetical protein SKAU_G00190280 [Synaphobranchus kaupii]|uniref:Ig-like domain-containing protein n=1 Tax=Synaphobranchus kaupii TaxID=118154 RepID=A0A9Q1FDH9_SYNKA|nr:hypothetical protein SKAU_G00190280 [Synaphobranchus kaupii]
MFQCLMQLEATQALIIYASSRGQYCSPVCTEEGKPQCFCSKYNTTDRLCRESLSHSKKLFSPQSCRMASRALIGFSILLYWLSCVAGVEFEQSPSLIARPGEDREIKCNHSESNYHNMYWYRKAVHGSVLVLIGSGHSRGNPAYEDQFKARFRLIREAVQSSSLHISALTVEDTAVYFCAASSHSAIS